MSEKRETILLLVQDKTGKITDVKVFQEGRPEEPETPEKPLTVIELKPDTTETYLRDLTEGSVVDWGDGTKSVVTAAEEKESFVTHTYADTSSANRVVTIDGVIDRIGDPVASAFDIASLVAVRSLEELRGEAARLFLQCSSLTAIPAGLFDHCTAVTSFRACFEDCNSLRTIPEGLFDHCTAVMDFEACFENCIGLTAIPEELFDHCTEVKDFNLCFSFCRGLRGSTPYTVVEGKKIRLWERSPENGFAKPDSSGVTYCFQGCSGLSDFAEIPNNWK